MDIFISHPAFQSGILPFVVALLAAGLLRRLGWLWAGLGFAMAFYVSVYVTAGIQLTPLTSTRKILLLGVVAVAVGLVLDRYRAHRRVVPWMLALLGAGLCLWVIWPVAKRQEGSALWLMILPSMAYVAWLITALSYGTRNKPALAAVAALALGLGTGISALLGASALLGQLGIAIGAAAGAYVLLYLLIQNMSLGDVFILPAALLSGLIGVAAVTYASMPWYSLVAIALIPLSVHVPLAKGATKFKQLLLLVLLTLPLAGIAIAITWGVEGAPLL